MTIISLKNCKLLLNQLFLNIFIKVYFSKLIFVIYYTFFLLNFLFITINSTFIVLPFIKNIFNILPEFFSNNVTYCANRRPIYDNDVEIDTQTLEEKLANLDAHSLIKLLNKRPNWTRETPETEVELYRQFTEIKKNPQALYNIELYLKDNLEIFRTMCNSSSFNSQIYTDLITQASVTRNNEHTIPQLNLLTCELALMRANGPLSIPLYAYSPIHQVLTSNEPLTVCDFYWIERYYNIPSFKSFSNLNDIKLGTGLALTLVEKEIGFELTSYVKSFLDFPYLQSKRYLIFKDLVQCLNEKNIYENTNNIRNFEEYREIHFSYTREMFLLQDQMSWSEIFTNKGISPKTFGRALGLSEYASLTFQRYCDNIKVDEYFPTIQSKRATEHVNSLDINWGF